MNYNKIVFYEKYKYQDIILNLFFFLFKKKEIQYFFYNGILVSLLNNIFKFLSINKIDFKFNEIKNLNKEHIWIKLDYHDLFEFSEKILKKKQFINLLNNNEYKYFKIYLQKLICQDNRKNDEIKHSLLATMMLINFCNIKAKVFKVEDIKIILENRLWKKEIKEYGKSLNIDLDFRYSVNFLLFKSIKDFFKKYFSTFKLIIKKIFKKKYNKLLINNLKKNIVVDNAIDFVNENKFWHQNIIPFDELLFTSRYSRRDIISSTNKSNMSYMSVEDYSKYRFNSKYLNIFTDKNNSYYSKFYNDKLAWIDFFKYNNSKIYLTAHRFSPESITASLAINELGGSSLFWQSSYYEFVNSTSQIIADVYFTFSTDRFSEENNKGSCVSNYICSGYPYDFNFQLNKSKSTGIRNKLLKNGAKKIIAFFDQGFSNDPKWFHGIDYISEQYIFLFEKLIQEKWMGLIIKPKQPALIKNIFDKIGKIYEKAIDSGRCYIYFEHDKYHVKNTKIPVSEASMAADLSIHNTLLSGTAGVESALSGTPTIFYDDFFIKKSLFYKYGENKIVFNDWNRMWSYLYSNIIKETIEKNSNWNSFLNHIDPFRDGKSSIRINKFVGNLSKFYKEGIQKKIALNEAKKIYANEWGKDKIKNFDKNFL